MEQRGHLNRIPELAASVWTGSPSDVFYGMYFEDKSFNDSMEDFSGMLLSQYADDDMASAYEDDEFAVEKAAYQIEMAGSTDPTALAGVAGMLTPWGPGFDMPQDIEAIIEEYPGISVGFNANAGLDGMPSGKAGLHHPLFDHADAIANSATFTDAVNDIEEQAEDQGLLGDIKNIFSGVGDWLADNMFSPLGEAAVTQGEGTRAMGAGIGDAITDSIAAAGDNWQLNQLGNQAAFQQILGQGVSEETNTRFNEVQDRSMEREFFQILDDVLKDEGPAALKAYIGDERNYQTGELDTGMVNSWLGHYRNSIADGPSDKWNMLQTWQNAVDDIQFSIEQQDKNVTATMQPTPTLATSIPGEENINRPYNWRPDNPMTAYLDEPGVTDPDQKPYNWRPFNPLLGPQPDDDDDVELSPVEQMLGRGLFDVVGTDEEVGAAEKADGVQVDGAQVDAEQVDGEQVDGADVIDIGDAFLDPGYPNYYTRFLNAFNQREGSGRYDYRQRLPELYSEAETLYYLTEPWSERFGANPYEVVMEQGERKPQFTYNEMMMEEDHFTNWANQFMDNPRDRRALFFDAAENLRDNMAQFIGVDYEDILGTTEMDANAHYQRMLFMDPISKGSFGRTARVVADYNLPPDAEPWLKQRMREQTAQDLVNWEAAGKTREEFLVTFMRERPY